MLGRISDVQTDICMSLNIYIVILQDIYLSVDEAYWCLIGHDVSYMCSPNHCSSPDTEKESAVHKLNNQRDATNHL